MITKSDSHEIRDVAFSLQSLGKLLEEDLELELLRAGADVVVTVLHRIKQEGKDALGGTLDTKSSERVGNYSKYWGEKRKKKGLLTSRVNMNYTGKMLLDYNLTIQEKRVVGVGFVSDESNTIAEYLEEYYGADICVPSEKEEDQILDDAMLRLETKIDKL